VDAAPGPGESGGTVQSAPGIAALLEELPTDGVDTVLDLGPAVGNNLRWFGRYARRLRFADLKRAWRSVGSLAEALDGLGHHPDAPYDLILAWDFIDQVSPEQRPGVVASLAAVSAPGARLHFMIDMSDLQFVRPARYSVVDAHHLRRDDAGPLQPAQPRLTPADVERLMAPFLILHAFVLRSGVREYVAVRR
jgi:hypothetical protein